MRPVPDLPGPPPEDDWIHPIDAAAKRNPLTGGGVRVIVMAEGDGAEADTIGQGLLDGGRVVRWHTR